MRQALAAHGRSPAEIQELLEADNQAPVVNLIALPGIGDLQEAFEKGAVEGELVEDSALYSAGRFWGRLESVREGYRACTGCRFAAGYSRACCSSS